MADYIYLPICLPIYLYICLSIYLSIVITLMGWMAKKQELFLRKMIDMNLLQRGNYGVGYIKDPYTVVSLGIIVKQSVK